MLGAVLTGPGRWTVDEIDDPRLGPGQVLVRTEIAAICGSDVHVAAGQTESAAPGFPGHEAVGVVVDSCASGFVPGDRVLCTPGAATARCYAQLQAISVNELVRLPSDGAAADLVAAQQLGTAVFAMKRFWPSDRLAAGTAVVLGAGPAGLAFVSLLRLIGFPNVIATDLSPIRLAAAAARGAGTVLDDNRDDVIEAVLSATDGVGAQLVIEAAGRDRTRRQAMSIVCDSGRIGLFGLEEHGRTESSYPFAALFRRRPTIEMTWGAQFESGLASFHSAVDLVVSGRVPSAMVTHVFPLSRIPEAFELAADPTAGSLKVAIDPWA